MKRSYLYFLALSLLVGCANPVPPSGGPTDDEPPAIIPSESTANQQTNFDKTGFTIVFDEWVKLKNIYQQIIISPPLRYKPEVKLKGRELSFSFDPRDTLKDNTTYTVQFGDGVVDLNEENPAEDLKFVFSTGAVLDSLTMTGKIVNIIDGEPSVNMRVMLYDELHDSLPLLERPTYVSRTNDAGSFRFENLRSDTFRLIAVMDENNDYMYAPDRETVAFSDTLIRLSADMNDVTLSAFDEVRAPKIVKRELQPDRLILAYDGKINDEFIRPVTDQVSFVEMLGDSMIYWLETRLDSVLVVQKFRSEVDSSWIKKDRKVRRDTMPVKLNRKAIDKRVTSPSDTLILPVNRSVITFDTTLIEISDTSRPYSFQITANAKRELLITTGWPQGEEMTFEALPGALTGVNEKTNRDTLTYGFFIPDVDKLGTITFEVDTLTGGPQRVIYLYKGDFLIHKFIVKPMPKKQTFRFEYLPAGKYEVLIIEDRNGNGRWDTGNYLDTIQPETRIRKNLEPLRENWDLNVNLQLEQN